MPKETPKRPTNAELTILRALWRLGPSTVREVHAELSRDRTTGYTTVLKQLQIMTEKGLVQRDESVRPQIYEPQRTERDTQRQMVRDLLDRAFAGSPGRLVLQALSMQKSTPQELDEIRRLLDDLEGQSR